MPFGNGLMVEGLGVARTGLLTKPCRHVLTPFHEFARTAPGQPQVRFAASGEAEAKWPATKPARWASTRPELNSKSPPGILGPQEPSGVHNLS